MEDSSEDLKQILERLGIKQGDPILQDTNEEIVYPYSEDFGSNRRDSVQDDEWCESINSDDLDVFKDYGTTPPKTERIRKQKGRDEYCSRAAAAAKAVTNKVKHKLASRCASLPVSATAPDFNYNGNAKSTNSSNYTTQHSKALTVFRQRKRSQDIQRSYERQCKFRMDEITPDLSTVSASTFEEELNEGPKCDSLPPIALAVKGMGVKPWYELTAPADLLSSGQFKHQPHITSLTVRVPPRSRYLSLSFKKIREKEGVQCPRKFSTADLPPDRVAFYSHISGLLKHSSQDQTVLLKSQRSEEEALYQQELNEMVWLELQAWHAGMSTLSYDNYLIQQREQVKCVYEEVMSFNFNQYCETSSPDATTKFTGKSFYIESSSLYSGIGEFNCKGCLSAWCERCRERESQALETVWRLLEKVSKVESLFPSTRKLCQFFPQWQDEEFVMSYKALCLWFNTTSQLRFVIDLLGRRLGHMTKDLIPWPNFPELKLKIRSPCHSTMSKDSGISSIHIEDSSTDCKIQRQKSVQSEFISKSYNQTAVVRFEIEDLDEGSTGSSDPNQSTESDFTSASSGSLHHRVRTLDVESDGDTPRNNHLSPPPMPGTLRRCSSDIFLRQNPYRTYVEKLLRNKGMKKTLDKVAEVIVDVMSRTISIIEESQSIHDGKDCSARTDNERLNPPPLCALHEELRRHQKWTAKFLCLGLPHFHTLFLFLASVPLHMMRECLKLRLEQMPDRPSRMSIKQLMREYKEGVKFAVAVRQNFVKWCLVLLSDLPPLLAHNLEARKTQAIGELDSNVKKMLEVYLNWLDQYILMLHKEPHVSGSQRNFLQDEWRFVQSTCPHVTDGESLAATTFCNIACHMLCSVRDFLDTGLDDMIRDFQESALESTDEEFDLEDEEVLKPVEVEEGEDGEGIYYEEGESNLQRRKLVQRCRSLQELETEARERALRAIALAKMLKKDLEVAIEVKELPDIEVLFDTMVELNYVLINGHSLKNLLIFVPENLQKSPKEILSLLQMQMGASSELSRLYPFKYLLLINKPQETQVQWTGMSIELQLTAECAITLSRIQVVGLMLMVKDGCQLQPVKRKLTEHFNGLLDFSNEQIAPHKAVTQSLHDMKSEGLQLCLSLEKSICEIEKLVNISQFFPNADEEYRQLSHLIRDTIHQGFIFGFEYHKEALRLVSGKQRNQLSPMLIKFGRHWMQFVRSNYSIGKGRRPRWALPGLEFLLIVCEPHNTIALSDSDFKNLRKEVEDCREYIVGSASNTDSSAPSTPLLMGKPFRSQSSLSSLSRQSSVDSAKFRGPSTLMRSNQPSIDKSEEDGPPGEPMEGVRDCIQKLENYLEEKRFKEKLVGRVSDSHRDLIEIKPHTVSFSWHRGFKIGAGHFAKVYTAVNNNSGELMAMKVLPLQPNDHRSIKRVASELHIFERIDHPHLVKYYGVEIHNDEMLMFMEYCEEGTLEALAQSTEGLPEEIVRKYTRQLLSAVLTLHENSIVHRDIKGANIFLALGGNILKLGDFGCAVRLHGFHTEVGELSGIVGTHAFMAPEIFRSNEGHGRAADIWSSGCVVIEMVTGKRPWPQYDSSVQIMFQVGNGQSPPSPDKLSEEGHDFLDLCFVQDPKKRATAAKLLDHTFVKVDDEENASIPLFSLMPFMHYERNQERILEERGSSSSN